MPRKKTIQPQPLQQFDLKDGTTVEVRDWRTREIGQGKDKEFNAEELDWQVLNGLFDDLQSENKGLQIRAKAALVSNGAMERFLHSAEYEMDERTGRRHGKSIREKYTLMRQIVGAVEFDSWQVHSAPSSSK